VPTPTPVAGGEQCPSCGAARPAGAPFCESCGHDFASPTPSPAPPAATVAAAATLAVVHADRAYFDAHGRGSGLDFPDPAPAPLSVPLGGDELLIGRRSQSRGVYPQIDLSGAQEDPAASHRHAALRRDGDAWTLTDLGSTNGTRIDDGEDPVTPGTPIRLAPGTRIYVGAWTCITLTVP
jgi:predicted component of type VI protein secretion system